MLFQYWATVFISSMYRVCWAVSACGQVIHIGSNQPCWGTPTTRSYFIFNLTCLSMFCNCSCLQYTLVYIPAKFQRYCMSLRGVKIEVSDASALKGGRYSLTSPVALWWIYCECGGHLQGWSNFKGKYLNDFNEQTYLRPSIMPFHWNWKVPPNLFES